MKSLFRSFPAVLVALIVSSASFAAPETLKIDPSHSIVGFQVRHFFAKTPGRFKEIDGTIQYDAKNPAASSVDVTIQAASIDTEHERRDNHLRTGDFFETEKFPTLTFKSRKVELAKGKTALAEGDKFQIHGDLTIKGITKPVTLDATFMGAGQVAIGGNSQGTVAGFEASTTINRKDYNILWNKALDQGGAMLGDDVFINLQVEAKTPRQAPPQAAKPADAKAADTKAADAKAEDRK